MAAIHRLLPDGARILDTLRLDAVPPLAFVLHERSPRDPDSVELTMFRFTAGRAEREDPGPFVRLIDEASRRKCFLVDVVSSGADLQDESALVRSEVMETRSEVRPASGRIASANRPDSAVLPPAARPLPPG